MNTPISHKTTTLKRICAVILLGGATIAGFTAISPSTSKQDQNATINKIAPWVLDRTSLGQAEYFVVLADQADLSGAAALHTKLEKGRFVFDTLLSKAQQTQGPILKMLRDSKVEYRSFYIVNMILVKGDFNLAFSLASRSDVARIEGNPTIRNVQDPLPVEEVSEQPPLAPETIEPGVSYVHAPQVWAAGFTGQGVVVGAADTGYRWTHNALKNHYRGWNGTTANHDYNWHDSIHAPATGGDCGVDSLQPCDDNGHGTHTAGTVLGDDGAGNQVGVAPGAKFICCRNMDQGNGTPARYMECFEFFLAPYPVLGFPGQGDPSKAPDVTTNSWACPASEGCSAATLQMGVEAQLAAGINMVVAAENGGSACSTVLDPPAIYAATYSVGALNTGADTIASFSSRGPVTADGSNRIKPDISAPGTNTRSSYRTSDTTYANLSGTSMATPHVAGCMALLLSARPVLRGNVGMQRTIMSNSALHINSSLCSSSGTFPNNVFGYGRIDVQAAVNTLLMTSAVSRKVHGAAGMFDIALPLSGEPGVECRNGGPGGNYTLVFTFDNNVVSGNAVVTSGTATVSGSPTFSGSTMTVNLTGVADVQKVTVKLTGVTDTSTPAQTLADQFVSMNVLAGDTNGNKVVNASDVAQAKGQVGVGLTTANFRDDVNENGGVSASDVTLVKSRVGNSVP